MKRVSIIEIINTPNAIIKKFGEHLYLTLLPQIKLNQPVCIDFKGLNNLTSGFCNASIGRLYFEFPSTAPILISFDNLSNNEIWSEKVNDAIYLAKNPNKAQLQDSALALLFAD